MDPNQSDTEAKPGRGVQPTAEDAVAADDRVTEREIERSLEDEEYTPVIIKRTDAKRRHPDDTLENAIEDGIEQLTRSPASLALSSLAAGLIVGFSPMAVAVVATALQAEQVSPLLVRIATALVYPLGFVICIMSGAQLFTEHTATAFYPVLDRQSSVGRLLRLWAIVIVGNLCGAGLGAFLHSMAVDVVDAREGYISLGHHLVEFASGTLIVSAILAGWLMALGAWLVVSSPRPGAQITFLFIVTFLIGIGGLHHSIAGSAELFTAMMLSAPISAANAIRFVIVCLLGNLVGGSCFVALLNYAHIREMQSY